MQEQRAQRLADELHRKEQRRKEKKQKRKDEKRGNTWMSSYSLKFVCFMGAISRDLVWVKSESVVVYGVPFLISFMLLFAIHYLITVTEAIFISDWEFTSQTVLNTHQ